MILQNHCHLAGIHTDSAVTGLEIFPIKGERGKNLCGDVKKKRDFARGVAFLGDISKLYLRSIMMNELASEPYSPFPQCNKPAENIGAMKFLIPLQQRKQY